jgi:ParB family chromosome partitioning protein
MAKRQALGKGLGALISDNVSANVSNNKSGSSKLNQEIDIELVNTNPNQPRSLFYEETLIELAESIKELGIIQPITVSKAEGGRYDLISGERRLRASKIADFKTIPAYIKETTNTTNMLEMALVENIQREDLDPLEIALSYRRLIEDCDLTQERLSERVGKKRSTITNYLRLLKLPVEIQKAIQNKNISLGHAKAIVGLKDENLQIDLCVEIIEQQLSVRQAEEMAKSLSSPKVEDKPKVKPSSVAEDYSNLMTNISKSFGTKVGLKLNTKGKGKIVIPIDSHEHFEAVVAKFDNLIN